MIHRPPAAISKLVCGSEKAPATQKHLPRARTLTSVGNPADEAFLGKSLRRAWTKKFSNVFWLAKANVLRITLTALIVSYVFSCSIILGQVTLIPPVLQEPETSATPQKSRPQTHGAIIDPNEEVLRQTPRIMGILPNFTAVDSNTRLPRLSTREKFIVAMHDSVDYSSFLLVAGLAGKGLSSNAIPSLGKGPAGFGRYYWREFTDQVSGTFFTEAVLPTLTHEDPRYYTLGKNGFFRRAAYAISRTVITKNDRGTNEFNVSEIGGNASEAALSNLYYPAAERGFGKSAKNFATQTVITAGANVLKEFWPDIRKNLFRIKDKSSLANPATLY